MDAAYFGVISILVVLIYYDSERICKRLDSILDELKDKQRGEQ